MFHLKPISLYAGEDFEFSLEDKKYSVYESQECIIKDAIEKKKLVLISIKRQPRYLIKIIQYSKINQNNFIEKEYKNLLDKTYQWYPENKNKGKNWNIHFTFELLEKY